MISSEGAGNIGLTNITLNGGGIPLPTPRRGLVHCLSGRDVASPIAKLPAAAVAVSGREQVSGDVRGTSSPSRAATHGLVDAQGLRVSATRLSRHERNGIEILRTAIGDDGTLGSTTGSRTSRRARPAPDKRQRHQRLRAGNVIVRGNRIRDGDDPRCVAIGMQHPHIRQQHQRRARDALYSEVASKVAVIANNTVDGAAVGVRFAFQRGRTYPRWCRATPSATC